ncbi:universal stress protein [Halomicrobium salinisoli]|uniref:universal stress protein n=1 Tax=Halomicrobium salinisoli TaxID=2878391 RepID=UPI001CF053F9|nr:universal stress protein [Halomicrobium salinisoli]
MTIETVLLPVSDADEDRLNRLVDAVLEIAGPTDATVVVAHAIPDEDDGVVTTIPAISGGNYPQVLSRPEYDDLLDQYPDDDQSVDDVVAEHETVQSVTDRLGDAGVEYAVRGAVGDPSEAILELAADVDADRLVIGGSRRTPTDKAVFGSLSQTLLLEAPCPVTFVHDE